jgi:hypothetical protein
VRYDITAASAAYLNIAVEPTPNSFRSYVAPAIGRGSPRALIIIHISDEGVWAQPPCLIYGINQEPSPYWLTKISS